MLMLFKPWRTNLDLKQPNESWPSAFVSFLKDAPHEVREIIKNVQFLHDCKDSCDDYFKQWESRKRNHNSRLPAEIFQKNVECDHVVPIDGEDIQATILEHLQSIDAIKTLQSSARFDKLFSALTLSMPLGCLKGGLLMGLAL